MAVPNWTLVAETSLSESEMVDFKSSFEPEKAGFWCEIVKDIISFANTSGGVIVFGLDSNGNPTEGNCEQAGTTDVANVSDQLTKYISTSINSLLKFTVERSGQKYWCISCDSERVLLPFTKPGTYEPIKGQQKNAFSVGTIYVRHGSKSEPCTRDDLQRWIDRELKLVREDWLSNIRKVVEAPFGHTVVVSSAAGEMVGQGATISARITNDPNAIPVRLQNPKQDWPHRGADILSTFNLKCLGYKMNSHDLVALKFGHQIDEVKRPDFMLKTHAFASPQYSSTFLEWIFAEYNKDNALFTKARQIWRVEHYGN